MKNPQTPFCLGQIMIAIPCHAVLSLADYVFFFFLNNIKERSSGRFCLLEEGGWLPKVICCQVGFRGVYMALL